LKEETVGLSQAHRRKKGPKTVKENDLALKRANSKRGDGWMDCSRERGGLCAPDQGEKGN